MKRLRAETREQHEALEQVVPLGSPGMSVRVYGRTLERFEGFYRTWEEQAVQAASARLRPMVEARQKLALIEDDLAFLGFARRAAGRRMDPALLPKLGTEAGLLGSMYVVEGSTLGGQIISRQLERELGFADGRGYSFFRSYGQAVGQQWKEFGAVVEAMPGEAAESMIAAARQTFAAFHVWVAGSVVLRAGERAERASEDGVLVSPDAAS